jgi:hypothetical protein
MEKTAPFLKKELSFILISWLGPSLSGDAGVFVNDNGAEKSLCSISQIYARKSDFMLEIGPFMLEIPDLCANPVPLPA